MLTLEREAEHRRGKLRKINRRMNGILYAMRRVKKLSRWGAGVTRGTISYLRAHMIYKHNYRTLLNVLDNQQDAYLAKDA